MFISIPKEFFVPVIFSDCFTLNEENNHLELDLNIYRESNSKKNTNVNIENNKEYLDKSKSAKEKQDIIEMKVNMNEKQCGNKTEVKEKEGCAIYIPLKGESHLEKICDRQREIFSDLDDEFLEKIDIKGCDERE